MSIRRSSTRRLPRLAAFVLVPLTLVVAVPSAALAATDSGWPAPTLTGFAPASGLIGSTVSLRGTGFTSARAVSFAGTAAATFTVNSDTEITATVPSGATTGPLSVTTAGGTVTSTMDFAPLPISASVAITSFLPCQGTVGATITVCGSGFASATAVSFDGQAAKFTVDSESKIVACVPAGAKTGLITITTPLGVAISTLGFTVLSKATLTLNLCGLSKSSLQLGKTLTAEGVATSVPAMEAVTLTVQRKLGSTWQLLKNLTCKLTTADTFRITYRPARVGTYRLRAKACATASTTAALSIWRACVVRSAAGGEIDARIAAALSWAKREIRDPSQNWSGRCLAFVSMAYSQGAHATITRRWETALQAAIGTDAITHSVTLPPPGAWVFWGWLSVGHVALSLGDGQVIQAWPGGVGVKGWGVEQVSLVSVSKLLTYIGWATPPLTPALRQIASPILASVGTTRSKACLAIYKPTSAVARASRQIAKK